MNPLKSFIVRLLLVLLIGAFAWSILLFWFFENKNHAKIDANIDHHLELLYKHFNSGSLNKLSTDPDFIKVIEISKHDGLEYLLLKSLDNNTSYHFNIGIESDVKTALYALSKNEFSLYRSSSDTSVYLLYNRVLTHQNITLLGAKQLDAQAINDFTQTSKIVLTMVFLTIIFLAVLLFPIIYKEYKALQRERLKLIESNFNIIKVLGNAVATKDSDTDEHNYRVTLYASYMGEALSLGLQEMQSLIKGAFLHDIGKIGITDSILKKPGKLTSDEFEIMKTHVTLGATIVSEIEWLNDARPVIEGHHEKVDGSGYPKGLIKEEIPRVARIFAIIDVFDALTSKRPYKEPFGYDEVFEILHQSSGNHFDPEILAIFIANAIQWHTHIIHLDRETLLQEVNKITYIIMKHPEL
jgi:putative nucleotidyltransferase with HDIG domain